MIEILPYAQINGAWSVPDTTIKAIWEQLILDGTANIVFSDGEIKDAGDFVGFAKNVNNLIALVYVDKDLSGLGWVNGINKDRAFAHYAFFKSEWGRNTDGMATALLNYWLLSEYPDGVAAFPFEMLIGQTPVWNRKAVKFLQRIGFTVLGILPKTTKGHGLVISYLTKEQYKNGRKQQEG